MLTSEQLVRHEPAVSVLESSLEAMQRGVQATREIILKLLDGLTLTEAHPVLLCDVLPNRPVVFHSFDVGCAFVRFLEWSSAVWDIQRDELTDQQKSKELPAMHYMGFIHVDDPLAEKAACQVAGQVLSQWWDSSPEAGPKKRPQTTFPDPLPNSSADNPRRNPAEDSWLKPCGSRGLFDLSPFMRASRLRIADMVRNKYAATHSGALKKVEDALTAETSIITALKTTAGECTTAGPDNTGRGQDAEKSRTLAHPDWNGETPPNFDRAETLPETPLDKFEAETQWLVCKF